MAHKRPRASDGAALSTDDGIDEALAAKRQHVQQPEQSHALQYAEEREHATPSVEQPSGNSTAYSSNGSASAATEAPPLQPPPSQQRAVVVSAMLFRPRQLEMAVAVAATPTQQHHKPVTTAASELPVLKTIDWRSTDDADDGDDMENDSQQREQEEDEDEQEEEEEDKQRERDNGGAMDGSAAEMELEGVVTRMHSLILPRRITFGRRQPMPITDLFGFRQGPANTKR